MEAKTETWDERRAREDKEDAAIRAKVRPLLCKALKLAGFTPTPEPRLRDGDPRPSGRTVWVEGVADSTVPELAGLTINARANGYGNEGRAAFRVSYPKPKVGEANTHEIVTPEITASLTKTPEALAADIKRRVLPDAAVGLAEVKKRNAKTEDYHARRDAALKAVLGRELTDNEKREGKSRFDGIAFGPRMSYGDVQAFGGHGAPGDDMAELNLELRGVPVAVAVEIMAVLRGKGG